MCGAAVRVSSLLYLSSVLENRESIMPTPHVCTRTLPGQVHMPLGKPDLVDTFETSEIRLVFTM